MRDHQWCDNQNWWSFSFTRTVLLHLLSLLRGVPREISALLSGHKSYETFFLERTGELCINILRRKGRGRNPRRYSYGPVSCPYNKPQKCSSLKHNDASTVFLCRIVMLDQQANCPLQCHSFLCSCFSNLFIC